MKKMIEIILIRHGETEFNKTGKFLGISDIGLNREGRKQARNLKKKFNGDEIDFVISSDLTRCRETAEIIFDGKIIYTPKLREMDFGRWDGLTWKEIVESDREEFLKWKKNWTKRPAPGGESFLDMSGRAIPVLEKLLAKNHRRCAVITHGGCIRTFLGHYITRSLKDSWRFQIDNGAVTRISFHDGYAYLKSLNER